MGLLIFSYMWSIQLKDSGEAGNCQNQLIDLMHNNLSHLTHNFWSDPILIACSFGE
jgi:hypothetical protein